MKQYLESLESILRLGKRRHNRTGVDTIGIFGHQMRFDLSEGFPAVTTKKLFMKGVVHELLWFLKGDQDIKYLQEHGIKIWDAWATEEGYVGPCYGYQWRSWHAGINSVDQIAQAIHTIKTNPDSRRIIVSAWNVADIPEMALPPCHLLFQFYVSDGALSCHLYQRSADFFLGVPFNIASYALLTHMVAQICDLKVGDFVHTFGDAHIYVNHLDQVQEQLSREPMKLPLLRMNPAIENIDRFEYSDIELVDYKHHPAIKGEVAV